METLSSGENSYILVDNEEQIADLPISRRKKDKLINKAKDIERDEEGNLKTPISVKVKGKRKCNQVFTPEESRSLRPRNLGMQK